MNETRPLLPCPECRLSLTSIRTATRHHLTSKPGHYLILLLVFLDVITIFTDLIIQILRCEHKLSNHASKEASKALGIVGLVFSCLFMAELLLAFWAFGFHYFRSKFHCFDATVIVTSFIIDVLLRGVLGEVASLVIILRLWRVFKIISELSVGAEDQVEDFRERIAILEMDKAKMQLELTRLKAQQSRDSYP